MKRIPGVRPVMALVFSGVMLFAVSNLAWSAESPGEATFKSKCVLCHGEDGTGNTPLGKQLQAANLHSPDVQKRTNAELHKVVHDGQTNMPAFADQLTDEEITQVIKYVRTFGKSAKK
ncbi:MAG TPA: cytochrome c [Terriglobales bacterium]